MELESQIPFLDPLLKEVALLVCTNQQCNASIIQRKFAVGYNRAGRIIDQLEEIGFVGSSRGLYNREVLCSDCSEIDFRIEKYIKSCNTPKNEVSESKHQDSTEKYDLNIEIIRVDNETLYIPTLCKANHISHIEKEYECGDFVCEIRNNEINKIRAITSHYLYILKHRIEIQFSDWNKRANRLEKIKRNKFKNISYNFEYFNDEGYSRALDIYYKDNIQSISNILHEGLIQRAIDFNEIFKCHVENNKPKPQPLFDKIMKGWDEKHILELEEIPQKPIPPSKDSYLPQLSWFDSFIGSKKRKEQQAYDEYKKAYKEYEAALEKWNDEIVRIKKTNDLKKKEHELQRDEAMRSFQEADTQKQDEWEKWDKMCRDLAKISEKEKEMFKEKYFAKEKSAIEDYCCIVLDKSVYNYPIDKDYVIEYNDSGFLVIEYRLPDISELPKYKECKYVSCEVRPKPISQTELNKIYDKMLYDISLRCIYELFDADCAGAVSAICFNGWVQTIDKATGNNVTNCVLSIQVDKNEFIKLDLANVDSKLCFKSLKGVSANKLCQLTPIKPILNIKKEDKRFIESKNVIENVDDSINLASMDWEDFEFLVREIFEKEFSANGGEVKITQASRDGGVDAIAFDPDPIRGGKIVIQAKRYTNTVGVSAVRDLWGTVMNEGAMKGLLVTTSDFGADSYAFVKDKPITLINGANLLFLLEKHGIHAKIDINEARMKKRVN